MKIAPIINRGLLIDRESPCSDFLSTNVEYILKQKNGGGILTKFTDLITRKTKIPKIILHVDAESNKTGLCSIIPKLCDYAFSKTIKRIEYTKYFSSKEYDAALIQSSERYVDSLSLSNGEPPVEPRVKTSRKTQDNYNVRLYYNNTDLMNFTYTRYENSSFYIQILRIVNYKNINEIYLDWNNKKIDRNSLLYFNYLVDKKLNKTVSKKELVKETLKQCKSLSSPLNIFKLGKIKDKARRGISLNSFIDHYKIVPKDERDIIKLTINSAYSLDSLNFALNVSDNKSMSAYNPFELGVAAQPQMWQYNKLLDSENLSITSSVRAITNGEHYDVNFKLIDSKLITKRQHNYKYRSWLKHLGDFGQALEFYGYTYDKFDATSFPIFISFDKICVYLSSLFNPLTALEDLNKYSYNKIQFYSFHGASNSSTGRVQTTYPPRFLGVINHDLFDDNVYFGKVNKRNIKQKNISKRLKFMSDLDIKNKLKSVGIKITKTIRGKRKYLSRKELENKAKLFNKIQNTARRMKIKIMYKKNRIYKYKTYKRLQKEIKKMKNKPRNKKMYNSRVKNFNFG